MVTAPKGLCPVVFMPMFICIHIGVFSLDKELFTRKMFLFTDTITKTFGSDAANYLLQKNAIKALCNITLSNEIFAAMYISS